MFHNPEVKVSRPIVTGNGRTLTADVFAGLTRIGAGTTASTNFFGGKLNFGNEFSIGGDLRLRLGSSVGYQLDFGRGSLNIGLKAFDSFGPHSNPSVGILFDLKF